MAKRHEAVKRLKAGKFLHLISSEMGVSFQTIVRYLKLQVAEGGVTASEVFFAIAPERRATLASFLQLSNGDATKRYYRQAEDAEISWDEANLYWSIVRSASHRGDMYERIADLEIDLHRHIQLTLVDKFGADGWWRGGVPLPVRKACVQAREEDPDPVESSYAYTTFIHLSEIIEKNWPLFSKALPDAFVSRKQEFLSELRRMNSIRNAVMHPVKQRQWTEDDFVSVDRLLKNLRSFRREALPVDRHITRTVTFGDHRQRGVKRCVA